MGDLRFFFIFYNSNNSHIRAKERMKNERRYVQRKTVYGRKDYRRKPGAAGWAGQPLNPLSYQALGGVAKRERNGKRCAFVSTASRKRLW